MKTIDINCLQWFDKVNGNSYFAAKVTVDYGMGSAKSFVLPFQYGYGDHYVDIAARDLDKKGFIELVKHNNGSSERLWQYCERNGIILRTNKETNCLKRELKALE